MVQFKTTLRSADNSGAQILKCLRIYGGSGRKKANLGDTILVSVKKIKNQKKAERKKMYLGVITASGSASFRFDGTKIKFDRNKVAIFSQGKFLGTRLYGPLCKEIKSKNFKNRYSQILSLSKGFI